MKAKDFIDIIEFTKAFKTEPKEKRRRMKLEKELTITELLHKELERSEALQKLLKDHEKANKKDEDKKKEEKAAWSAPHIAMFLVFTFPITAPLYVAYVKTLLH